MSGLSEKTCIPCRGGVPPLTAEQIKPLAKLGRIRVVLFHVDRWTAPARGEYPLYAEANDDIDYFKKIRGEFSSEGIPADLELAYGEPAAEIVKRVQQNGCDLVVMNTQSRRSVFDVLFGTVLEKVRSAIDVPVLLFKAT